MSKPGSLTCVGTGIRLAAHLTTEARAHLTGAEQLLHLMGDPLSSEWMLELNPSAESLGQFYERSKDRRITYRQIADEIVRRVRTGVDVCVAHYGHPGVFVQPSHLAIAGARAEGYAARMLPGISAEDCLFADLDLDPGHRGCQSFEATNFLVFRRRFDPTVLLVLWQVGSIGRLDSDFGDLSQPLGVLGSVLESNYGADHEAILYEAGRYPGAEGRAERVRLGELGQATVSTITTLVIPPLPDRSPDQEMAERLGMAAAELAPIDTSRWKGAQSPACS